MSDVPLFSYIDFETYSYCNRVCPTCIRNSHPNRIALQGWFEHNYLPIDVIELALDQCVDIGFTGGVCLSHYNEPLMDGRLPEIAKIVRGYNHFSRIFLNTNGDHLTEELADELDGNLDDIIITLYMDEPIKSKRAEWIKTLFHKTHVEIIMQSDHIATHFSPKFDIEALIKQHIDNPCGEPRIRVIINHQRKYLLCCDDVIGNFDLGMFPEISIKDFWFGDKRVQIMNDLMFNGNRKKYPYCATCPRS